MSDKRDRDAGKDGVDGAHLHGGRATKKRRQAAVVVVVVTDENEKKPRRNPPRGRVHASDSHGAQGNDMKCVCWGVGVRACVRVACVLCLSGGHHCSAPRVAVLGGALTVCDMCVCVCDMCVCVCVCVCVPVCVVSLFRAEGSSTAADRGTPCEG